MPGARGRAPGGTAGGGGGCGLAGAGSMQRQLQRMLQWRARARRGQGHMASATGSADSKCGGGRADYRRAGRGGAAGGRGRARAGLCGRKKYIKIWPNHKTDHVSAPQTWARTQSHAVKTVCANYCSTGADIKSYTCHLSDSVFHVNINPSWLREPKQ